MNATQEVSFGYTLMTEQSGPKELVRYAQAADAAGFDFIVSSDHYFPWLVSQGHAPYAWAILGAVAHVTERAELMSYVTCPTRRYHPAVVAQKAATLQLLAGGRFTLGLGAGENLNEHVVGAGWPGVDTRHEMLAEAIDVIRALHTGELVTYRGRHFGVDSARIWDLPETPVRIGVAVSGAKSCSRFAALGDDMIAVQPNAELVQRWDAERAGKLGGDGEAGPSRKIGQIPISWDRDEQAAADRAHEQFRWFGSGWPVNANLATTEAFAAANRYVRREDVAKAIPCGADVGGVVKAVSAFWQAGFTDIALVQIGGRPEQQDAFLDAAKQELLPALREASSTASERRQPAAH